MNKEEIAIYKNDFVKEIWQNSKRFSNSNYDVPRYVEVNKIFEIVEKYKDKEIDRLNNIIKELENFLYDQKEIFRDVNIKLFVAMVLDKLKELKEGNK